jgi:hypothetical protein
MPVVLVLPLVAVELLVPVLDVVVLDVAVLVPDVEVTKSLAMLNADGATLSISSCWK